MGSWGRSVGRGHRGAPQGQSCGRGARRMGPGLGSSRDSLHHSVQHPARQLGLAGYVLSRTHPGASGDLHSTLRAGTGGVRSDQARGRSTPATFHLPGNFRTLALPTTLLAAMLVTGAQGGYYAITIWLPTFLKTV